MQRLQLHIGGRVQGVGYRYATTRKAQELGLVGWVRNLPNGQVEVVAEGPEEDLRALLAWCMRGPSGALVRGIEELWETATYAFHSFETRRGP